MVKKRFSTVSITPEQLYIWNRVARIKRWTLTTLTSFLTEMFVSSMELLKDPDVDIETLRKYYEHWQLAVYPYGFERGEKNE